ncbi:rhodanese-like domain-containing protein [Erythrobacter sp. SDW2]|uniref:rhodanese-like domain-containing protein n=1 Tax=Erythrobacter sp. SDW2 TaxID=2907154 RepID=UPI001F243020|nr:rhodanese-like domain-containing protein [Erythrobacter sp. SDW2]UIP06793.1 rhodanese-like domain-containing protein [Erythrobacter sp. SDW2]
MRTRLTLIAALAWAAAPLQAQEAPDNLLIDYAAFEKLTAEVAPYRETRRIPLTQFLSLAQQEGVILLDARSETAFALGHIEGAINLPFSDFTDEKLVKVLGDDKDRPILIYCNNNFSDNVVPVVTKRAPLALNIPTFINLYGYGYTNIWELADVVERRDVAWVSSIAEQP